MPKANRKPVNTNPTLEYEIFGFDEQGKDVNIPYSVFVNLNNGGGLNTIQDALDLKAWVNGDTAELFSVADGYEPNHAVSFRQLQESILDETLTTLVLAGNILKYTDESGTETVLDLSLYLDDANLARLISGTLDASTGIATFTRDDTSTFTIDMSSFLDAITLNNTLTSTSTTEGLTANMGKELKSLIDNLVLSTGINTGDQDLSGFLKNTTDSLIGSLIVTVNISSPNVNLNQIRSKESDGDIIIKNYAGETILSLKNDKSGAFEGPISAPNLSGTNTGDQDLSELISNATDSYTSASKVTNIISLTQIDYDDITTPDVNTLYIII